MYPRTIVAGILAVVGFAAISTIVTHAYSLTSYKWVSFPVPVYVNASNQDVSASAAIAAVQAAMAEWNQAGTPFRYSYAGQVNDTTTAVDGRNVIIFRNTTSGGTAVATTYSWASGGVRIESDIVFWDGAYKFFTGASGCAYTNGQYGAYIEDIAAHELGHGLGIAHSSNSGATMYPTYTACSTSWRTLHDDDLAGVQAFYGSTTANTAPSVTISSPSNGASVAQGTATTFNGSATDTQDGNLTTSLSWTSSLDGAIGTGSGFSKALSVGTHTITANATDKGGMSGSKQLSMTVTSTTNTAPSVTISTPSNGASVPQGTTTTFAGSATDTQDGNLTTSLSWTSSLDGSIGTGSGFSRALSVGTHTITAKAIDKGGLSGSKTVSMTVTAVTPNPTGASLTARGYKVKGEHHADLSWTGLTTGVDIFRNGTRIVTNSANDGAYTDAIGAKGGGIYTYRVCPTGTTTGCTNNAQISF